MDELAERIRQQNIEKESENRAVAALRAAAVAKQEATISQEDAALSSQLHSAASGRQPMLPNEAELLAEEQELDRQLEVERRLARMEVGRGRASGSSRALPVRSDSAKGGKENKRAAIPMIPPSESNADLHAGADSRERRHRPVHYSHSMAKPETTTSQMDLFMKPVKGIRDEMRRAGIEPKDHRRENQQHLHSIAARRQRAEMATLDASQEKLRREESIREKARAQAQQTLAANGPARGRRPPPAHERVPSAEPRTHEAGAVPAYLQRRKAEWAAQAQAEEAAQIARAECPPGLRIVAPDEKARILQTLSNERAKAEESLRALPFVIKTNASAQKKDALENRLQEIEGAIEAYSKEKVLVPVD